jgi:O-methyltransferase involved in polyketide biosynthesis
VIDLQHKVKVELGGISASLLAPSWGRAQVSREYGSLFYDAKAIELVERIDYDFSTSDIPFKDIIVQQMFNIPLEGGLTLLSLFTLRAKQFDDKVKAYLTEHPRASVVNIGAGLNTTFYRVDNGTIHCYDLDLPAVIEVRRQLLPEPERVTYIVKSLLDPSWFEDVKHTEDGVFMVAGEVLGWLEESQAKQFFSMLADNLPGGEIVFDAQSKPGCITGGGAFGALDDQFPPEQLDAMKAWVMAQFKRFWEQAPQDLKETIIASLTTSLKTSVKPDGTEWADFEVWWNTLSAKEVEGALHCFGASYNGLQKGVGLWTLEDANDITKGDNRITVIDQFPMFKNIKRDSLSIEFRQFMDYNDRSGGLNIIHLRV